MPRQQIETVYEKGIIPNAYIELIKRNESKINLDAGNVEKIAIPETVSLAGKVKDIFRELLRTPRFVLNKLFKKNNYSKIEIVTSFIGLLELARKNKVTAQQKKIFGDIVVEKVKR